MSPLAENRKALKLKKRSGRMKAIAKMSLVTIAALLSAGCSTILDESKSIIVRTVAPKADRGEDGKFIPPEFSQADTGARFSTASAGAAAQSFRTMVGSLQPNEKVYFTRAMFAVVHYEGCVKHGYTTHTLSKSPVLSKRSPGQCDMIPLYEFTDNFADTLLNTGRPDGNTRRVVQTTTLTGAPVGDPELRGYGDSEAWQRWINWSAYELNGLTRTEIMQRFLEGTNGTMSRIPGG
jgi:hypothetical protein